MASRLGLGLAFGRDGVGVVHREHRAHEPGQVGIDAACELIDFWRLNAWFALEKVYTDGIVKYGNTSAASIPLGYEDTRSRWEGDAGSGLVLNLTTGPGGSLMPGGSTSAFFRNPSTRGPTPFSVWAEANNGLRMLGRIS